MHAFIGAKGQVNIGQPGFLFLRHGLLEKYDTITPKLVGIARQFINLPALIAVNDKLGIGARFGHGGKARNIGHYSVASAQFDFQ